jgi:hypothetical protein
MQTHRSLRILLGKSLRGCGATFSEELTEVDTDTIICLRGRPLDASLREDDFALPADAVSRSA